MKKWEKIHSVSCWCRCCRLNQHPLHSLNIKKPHTSRVKKNFFVPWFKGGEHIARNRGIKFKPNLVSFVIDVPSCVEWTVSGLKKNIFQNWATLIEHHLFDHQKLNYTNRIVLYLYVCSDTWLAKTYFELVSSACFLSVDRVVNSEKIPFVRQLTFNESDAF